MSCRVYNENTMKTIKKHTKTIVIGVFSIIIIGVLYFLGQQGSPTGLVTTQNPSTNTPEHVISTTTPGIVTVKTYINKKSGYQIGYRSDMVLKENDYLPSATVAGLIGTTFTIPRSYFGDGTFAQARISVFITDTACSLSASEGVPLVPSRTVMKNGHSFTVTKIADAGAGHYFYETEYGTMYGGRCYRVSLYEHLLNPGNVYGSDNKRIVAAEQANAATRKKMAALLDATVDSFIITAK